MQPIQIPRQRQLPPVPRPTPPTRRRIAIPRRRTVLPIRIHRPWAIISVMPPPPRAVQVVVPIIASRRASQGARAGGDGVLVDTVQEALDDAEGDEAAHVDVRQQRTVLEDPRAQRHALAHAAVQLDQRVGGDDGLVGRQHEVGGRERGRRRRVRAQRRRAVRPVVQEGRLGGAAGRRCGGGGRTEGAADAGFAGVAVGGLVRVTAELLGEGVVAAE